MEWGIGDNNARDDGLVELLAADSQMSWSGPASEALPSIKGLTLACGSLQPDSQRGPPVICRALPIDRMVYGKDRYPQPVSSRILLCLVLFVIFAGGQSIAGIAAETKSVTGEPLTFAVSERTPQHPLDIPLPAPQRTWKSSGHTSYYVDSRHGDDTNDGLSEARPWRSLNRVNAGEFAAGDKILLRAGSRWRAFLSPGGSGAAGQPIVIDQYGRGSKPRINAQGSSLATVFLSNIEYLEVRNLDVANEGSAFHSKLNGVQISENDFGTAHDILLKDLYVHDVNGSNDKQFGGSGLFCECGGNKVKSRFDRLLVEHCHLVHTTGTASR